LKILEASPGFGRPLNEQETKDFLTAGKLNVHLGAVDEKGDANIHPAWYYYDLPTNKIYMETSKQAKKTYNLRKKRMFTFVSMIRILRIRGHVVREL
jgi:general stress protein 26